MPKICDLPINKVTNHQLVTDDVQVAGVWLKDGRLIAYPTESVWGIGCNPFDKVAVERLLSLKHRSVDKGLIVVTSSHLFLKDFLEVLPIDRQDDVIKFWQFAQHQSQATTWLLPIPKNLSMSIPTWVTGGRDSLAVRVISHSSIANLCELVAKTINPYGFLVSTSCNPSSLPPAKDFATAYGYFGDEVGYLLGETLGYDKPSQILDGRTGQAVRF